MRPATMLRSAVVFVLLAPSKEIIPSDTPYYTTTAAYHVLYSNPAIHVEISHLTSDKIDDAIQPNQFVSPALDFRQMIPLYTAYMSGPIQDEFCPHKLKNLDSKFCLIYVRIIPDIFTKRKQLIF
jgi:hypothetical protein